MVQNDCETLSEDPSKPVACHQCGAPILGAAPEGLCPKCLVSMGLSLISTQRGDPGEGSPTPINPPPGPLRRFGDYELLNEIARGGMGIVYRARQISLNRTVAVKVLLFGQFASDAFVKRFRAEAEAAASLQHPNVVAVHEVGQHDGQHYFSMELVEGHDLAALVREKPLAPKEAARYLKTIAEAVEYAHRHGVLHRDLKPSNVLIDTEGQPRVTDFGLAKRLVGTRSGGVTDAVERVPTEDLTLTGQVLGSPNFMPPEQADPTRGAVSPASDVYSLGAILYHLVTGRPPFLAEALEQTLSHLLNRDPVAPRLLNPAIPRDLETICLRCLEKDPARRYAAASQLADELGRFLRDEPILARPAGPPEKLWRWCRRQPVLAGSMVLVALALVSVAIVSSVAARRVTRSARLVEKERASVVQANRDLGDSVQRLELQLAEERFHADDVGGGLAFLAAVVRRDPSNHIAAQRLVSALLHRNFPMPAGPPLSGLGRVWHVEFSADGRRLLVLWEDVSPQGRQSFARIWDAATSEPLTRPLENAGLILRARFSPDGRRLVTASADHTARVWDAFTGTPLTPPLTHGALIQAVRFSPDGTQILTVTGERKARLWNSATGQILKVWLVHNSTPVDARFSPDGKLIATASRFGSVRIWYAATGVAATEYLSGTNLSLGVEIHSVQFSTDGQRILTVSADHAARLWDVRSGALIGQPMRHREAVSAELSPDGEHLVTASADHTAQIWDARTAQTIGPPLRHNGALADVQFSPDGSRVLTTSWDNTAQLWDVASGRRICAPLRHHERVWAVHFSPDGERVITGAADGVAQVWDVRPSAVPEVVVRHSNAVAFAAFSPDGGSFATASDNHTARIWNAMTGAPRSPPLSHKAKILKLEFSPDGRRLVTASMDGTARLWETTGGKALAVLRHKSGIWSAHFDSSSRRVVTASADHTAQLWDADSGQPLTPPLSHEASVGEARFSPDGSRIATAANDHTARLWDARTGEPISPKLTHQDDVLAVEFSPDGERLATASTDKTARLWHGRTGEPVGSAMQHVALVCGIDFSPNGRQLVTASWDRTARVWDVASGTALGEAMQHDDQLRTARFSPDGQRIVTASLDGTARVWDAVTGRPVSEPLRHGSKVFSAQFSPAGLRVLTASADGTARVWDVPLVPVPAPEWLPDLAEALGGFHLDAQRNPVFTGRTALEEIKGEAAPVSKDFYKDFYARFRQWFFADRVLRNAAPQ